MSDPELAVLLCSVGQRELHGGSLLTLLMGIAFILSGLIVGGSMPLTLLFTKVIRDVSAGVSGRTSPNYLPRVEEEVRSPDNMAVISVPPPRVPVRLPRLHLHDFHMCGLDTHHTHNPTDLLAVFEVAHVRVSRRVSRRLRVPASKLFGALTMSSPAGLGVGVAWAVLGVAEDGEVTQHRTTISQPETILTQVPFSLDELCFRGNQFELHAQACHAIKRWG
ncbi:unnamed protein product [Arctogadus glacialis]